MPRRARRLAIGLCAFSVLFFTVYTGVYLIWNDEAIAGTVSDWISSSLKGKGGKTNQAMVIGRAHYPYWGALKSLFLGGPAWVEIWDTAIYDPDGNEVMFIPYGRGQMWLGETVWSQARSALPGQRYNLELHFANADAPTGRCHIALDRAGEVNLVDAMSSKVATATDGGMRIRLDSATVHDAEFSMALPGWHAEADGVAANAHLAVSTFPEEQEPGRPAFTYEVTPLTAVTGRLTLGETLPVGTRAGPRGSGPPTAPAKGVPAPYVFPLEAIAATRFGAFADRTQDLVFSATATSRGAPATVEGRLVDTYGTRPGVDLTIAFSHGAGLLKMLPTGDLLGGDPAGEVRIHGPFEHVLIDGHAGGAELRLAGVVGREARAAFHLDGPLLTLSDARVAVGGGTVGGVVAIDFARMAWRGDLVSDRVDPSGLAPLVPEPARKVLAGRLGGKLHVEGSLDQHPERIKVRDLSLDLRRSARDSLPREVAIRGGLRYAPERIHLDGVGLSGDGVTVTARGAIDPRKATTSAELTIDARRLGPLLRRLGIEGVEVNGMHATASVNGPLLSPTAEGTFGVASIGYEDLVIPRASAHLRFSDGTLQATDLRAGGPLGAQLHGEISLGLFDGTLSRPRPDPTLRLRLGTRGIALASFGGDALTGLLTGNLHLEGTLRHPVGTADLEVPEMKVYGDPYRRGQLSVAIREGGLDVKKLYLQREGGGAIEGTRGTIATDGSIDLHLVSKDFPLAAIPQLRDLPVPLAGTLSGAVRIGGDLRRWSPEGVIEALQVKVRDILLGDGQVHLTPGGDAIRIAGEFFRRFRIEGSLTLFPRVSCNVTIDFTDFPIHELLPELQKVVELSGTVSGRATISYNVATGTFAELRLSKVLFTLSSDEEDAHELAHASRDEFRNDGDVVITTDGKKVTVKQARMRSRIGEFEVRGDLSATASNLIVRGQIELALVEYFASSLFSHTHGDAFADLRILGPAAKPQVLGSLELRGAELKPRGADRSVTVPSGRLVFAEDRLTLSKLRLQLDGAEATASGTLALKNWRPGEVALDVQGELSPALVAMIFQFAGADWYADHIGEATGRLGIAAQVKGIWPTPSWSGRIDLSDIAFKEKRLSRDVRIGSGTVMLRDYDLALGCPAGSPPAGCKTVTAKIDDGEVRIDGVIGLPGFQLGRVAVHLDGENLDWGTSAYAITLSPRVDLRGTGERLHLSGAVTLVTGRYKEDFDVYGNLVFRPRTDEREEPFYKDWPLIEHLGLDLMISSSGALAIKNNIADLNVSVQSLALAGTLSAPSLKGEIIVEEGGTFKIPFLRTDFVSEKSTMTFEAGKEFPTRTPRLNLNASSDWQDRFDQIHHIVLEIRGTYQEPEIDLRSTTDGWDKTKTLQTLFTGSDPDALRRSIQNDPTQKAGGGADGLIKSVTGDAFGNLLEDPLRKVFQLDVARIELGSDSVKILLCPYKTRYLKLCGTGDVGFVTTTRYVASGELKLSDVFSLIGSVEHIEHGLDTSEDILNRGKLQLLIKSPLR
ncbi:MAG: hypothetical protein EXR72_21740 [Myxococcales bacterium]|nr:hypothetical protein [Myxococcales bacterium]